VRALAALLLLTLACGTVAEFTHSHQDRASGLVAATRTPDTGFDLVESSGTSNSSSRSKSAAECLICQLHQNLSNTYFTHTPAVAPTETQSFALSTTVSFHRDDFSSSQRGRAPPTNL
jgi:hypothetical protein